MPKVYVVEGSAGSYDDVSFWIAGVFSTAEKAKLAVTELEMRNAENQKALKAWETELDQNVKTALRQAGKLGKFDKGIVSICLAVVDKMPPRPSGVREDIFYNILDAEMDTLL